MSLRGLHAVGLCFCVVVGGHSAQGSRERRFDIVKVVSLRRDAQVVSRLRR